MDPGLLRILCVYKQVQRSSGPLIACVQMRWSQRCEVGIEQSALVRRRARERAAEKGEGQGHGGAATWICGFMAALAVVVVLAVVSVGGVDLTARRPLALHRTTCNRQLQVCTLAELDAAPASTSLIRLD